MGIALDRKEKMKDISFLQSKLGAIKLAEHTCDRSHHHLSYNEFEEMG
jgi:hypothetical protein